LLAEPVKNAGTQHTRARRRRRRRRTAAPRNGIPANGISICSGVGPIRPEPVSSLNGGCT